MASPLQINLADEQATARLASALARRAQPGDVIALSGPLGSGKTSFARAFVRSFLPAEEVPSPTFTLVQTYETPPGMIWHFDLYRLQDPEEVWELGFEDAVTDGISLIEWPERLAGRLPAERLELALAAGTDPAARVARLTFSPRWTARLDGLAADV